MINTNGKTAVLNARPKSLSDQTSLARTSLQGMTSAEADKLESLRNLMIYGRQSIEAEDSKM
jgi:hypothetical protein